jgi:hypothetical protein
MKKKKREINIFDIPHRAARLTHQLKSFDGFQRVRFGSRLIRVRERVVHSKLTAQNANTPTPDFCKQYHWNTSLL